MPLLDEMLSQQTVDSVASFQYRFIVHQFSLFSDWIRDRFFTCVRLLGSFIVRTESIIENIENLDIIVDKKTNKSLQGDDKIKDCFESLMMIN